MSCLGAIAIPSPDQCLSVLAPLAGLAAFVWLLQNADELIRRHLPGLEWGRRMGWFNLRAERRAKRFLRGVEAIFHFLLVAALYGILWGANRLSELAHWRDPEVPLRLQNHLPVLVLSAGLWIVYLSADLLPRLRREFEEEELERYRAENTLEEGEEVTEGPSRQAESSRRRMSPPPRRYRRQP